MYFFGIIQGQIQNIFHYDIEFNILYTDKLMAGNCTVEIGNDKIQMIVDLRLKRAIPSTRADRFVKPTYISKVCCVPNVLWLEYPVLFKDKYHVHIHQECNWITNIVWSVAITKAHLPLFCAVIHTESKLWLIRSSPHPHLAFRRKQVSLFFFILQKSVAWTSTVESMPVSSFYIYSCSCFSIFNITTPEHMDESCYKIYRSYCPVCIVISSLTACLKLGDIFLLANLTHKSILFSLLFSCAIIIFCENA